MTDYIVERWDDGAWIPFATCKTLDEIRLEVARLKEMGYAGKDLRLTKIIREKVHDTI